MVGTNSITEPFLCMRPISVLIRNYMNTLASLSNLFGGDMWILLLIVLILFGAKKLPELAKGAGQAIREFNKAKDEFEREITKPAEEVKVHPPQGSLPYTPPAYVPPAPAPQAQPQVVQSQPVQPPVPEQPGIHPTQA